VADMSPLAQRVANAVYLSSPRVLCFPCLAGQHGLNEHDTRAAALVLVARAGFGLVRQACSSCQSVDEVLVGEIAA
jgi:hypothetical protein